MKKILELKKETIQMLNADTMGNAYGGSNWCVTGYPCEMYDTLGAYCTWETVPEPASGTCPEDCEIFLSQIPADCQEEISIGVDCAVVESDGMTACHD